MTAPRCGGSCNQGRTACDCELANAVAPRLDLVRSTPSRPPIQVSGGRVPLRRRARRLAQALWDHLRSPRFEP